MIPLTHKAFLLFHPLLPARDHRPPLLLLIDTEGFDSEGFDSEGFDSEGDYRLIVASAKP